MLCGFMHVKQTAKKLIPRRLVRLYHFFYAWYGAFKYNHPSEELLVIGITGTSGKSSTAYFLRQILEKAGFKVGVLSTIEFCVAGDCKLNDKKMTMLGRTEIQSYIRKMVDKKCDIAIIETTSEGYLQHRHRFINYDMIVLTNLYPEHIDSHGSFENYKAAKLGIFRYVAGCKSKKDVGGYPDNPDLRINGKVAIVNHGSKYKDEFLKYDFEKYL